MRIRQKINLAVVAVVALTLFTSTVVSILLDQGKLEEQVKRNAESSIERIGITLSNPLWKMDIKTARKVIQSELGSNNLIAVNVIGSDQKPLFSYALDEESGVIREQAFTQQSYISQESIIYFEIQSDQYEAGRVQLYFSDLSIMRAIESKIKSGLIQVLLLSIIIALVMRVLLGRIIINPLHDMRDRVMDIAQGEGDLTQRIHTHGSDELSELGCGINQFIENVHNIIGELSHLVESMDKATHQGNQTTSHLNDSVLMLSSEVSQIANAMNEISATSRNVSSQTSELSTILGDTTTLAEEGTTFIGTAQDITNQLAESVNRSGNQMAELDRHTQEIGSVVTVIENIAEQTNLLALNAAIEAARAGEHGRGFAVVSDEVRSLAQKTQDSISEIVSIVDRLQALSKETYSAMSSSLEQVDASVTSVKSAGDSFTDITQAVHQNLSSSDMIATAVEEQAQTLDVIDKNIREIERINEDTQRISASNAEINDDIYTSSQKLKALVEKFKI